MRVKDHAFCRTTVWTVHTDDSVAVMNEDHCQIECDVSSRSTPSPVTGGGGMYEEQYGRGMDH